MPSGGTSHPSVARLYTDAIGSHRIQVSSVVRLEQWTMSHELIEGHEWEA